MADSEKELTQKFMQFEQQVRFIQEQLEAVDKAILDLDSLNSGLDELIDKRDNEILAQVGRGIYAKAKLISDELIVDVGGKNFVKKSIPSTKEILENQSKKLKGIKGNLTNEMQRIDEELTRTFMEHQTNQKKE
jgi:prefoldin alpha subunit